MLQRKNHLKAVTCVASWSGIADIMLPFPSPQSHVAHEEKGLCAMSPAFHQPFMSETFRIKFKSSLLPITFTAFLRKKTTLQTKSDINHFNPSSRTPHTAKGGNNPPFAVGGGRTRLPHSPTAKGGPTLHGGWAYLHGGQSPISLEYQI